MNDSGLEESYGLQRLVLFFSSFAFGWIDTIDRADFGLEESYTVPRLVFSFFLSFTLSVGLIRLKELS